MPDHRTDPRPTGPTPGDPPAPSARGRVPTGLPRAGAGLVVVLVAAYLAWATVDHSLLGLPLPVLGAMLLPLALAGAGLVRHGIGPRSAAEDGFPDRRHRPRVEGLPLPGPVEAVAAVAVVATLLNDASLFLSPAMRDLALYLHAGWSFDHALPVYLQAPMTALPSDPTLLPFLYPPFTLPLFGALATLPWTLVAAAWLAGSIAASVAALRLLGLSWRWSAAFLLWPPFAEGLYVGNVAVPALLLFAAAIRAGSTLPLGAIFKVQSGIPALWLVRERRGRELALGLGTILVLVVGTLPLVGHDRWGEWLDGLLRFRASESALPALAGQSLSVHVPTIAWLGIAAAAVGLALRSSGREGLKRIGIATIVGSPSLYSHGFLVGLPAFLALNRFWFWVAIACTASVWGPGWWAAVAIAVAAWHVPAMNHRLAPNERLHPLQGSARPWQRPVDWAGVGLPAAVRRGAPSDV